MTAQGAIKKEEKLKGHVPQLQGENLRLLKSYIRNAQFRELLNTLVRSQAELGYKSLSVLSRDSGTDKSLFLSSLALAYTCYLQSRVLIVETVDQPMDRSLFVKSVLGEHAPDGEAAGWATEGGSIDFLSTASFFEGERELADFHLGEYIRQVQSRYDLVLVDTAPLDKEDDNIIHPLIISSYTDQSVLVVRSERKALKSINETIEQLKVNGVSLLGIVEEGKAANRRKK